MKIEDVYPVSPLQAGLYYHWMISPSIYLAQLSYRLKGHFDIAILEKSYEQRTQVVYRLKCRPMFDSLRSDPRYDELLRKMNLTP